MFGSGRQGLSLIVGEGKVASGVMVVERRLPVERRGNRR